MQVITSTASLPELEPVSPTATITVSLTATNKRSAVPTDSARAYDDVGESVIKCALVDDDASDVGVTDAPAVDDTSDVDGADAPVGCLSTAALTATSASSANKLAAAPAVIDNSRAAAQAGEPTGSCTLTALPRSKPTRLTACKRIAQRAVQRMRTASAAAARRGARAKRAMTGCLTGGGAADDGV